MDNDRYESTMNKNTEAYESDYPLERIFPTTSARLIDFLSLNQKLNYTENEIGEEANIPLRTLQRVLYELIDEGLITREKKEGNAYRYEINLNSERARALILYIKSTVRENIRNPSFFKKTYSAIRD
jgi:transcription initiation factor IIE alpha subunit